LICVLSAIPAVRRARDFRRAPPFADALKLFFERFQVFVGKFFQIDKLISSTFEGADDLIQFQVDRFGATMRGWPCR
jgi:hypothetical protein